MATNVYECLFILDSNRYAKDPNGVSSTIPDMVQKVDGELLVSRLWNEQKLAYPINGQRKGTYWLTYLRLDSGKLSDFNRACKLNDYVHRHLVLKVDPRLVDVLVSHARGTSSTEEPSAEESGETAKAGDTKAVEASS